VRLLFRLDRLSITNRFRRFPVPRFPISRFPVLQFGAMFSSFAAISSLAFSAPPPMRLYVRLPWSLVNILIVFLLLHPVSGRRDNCSLCMRQERSPGNSIAAACHCSEVLHTSGALPPAESDESFRADNDGKTVKFITPSVHLCRDNKSRRSMCRGEILKVQSSRHSARGKYARAVD